MGKENTNGKIDLTVFTSEVGLKINIAKRNHLVQMGHLNLLYLCNSVFFFLREKNTPLRENFRRTLREDSDPYVKIS